VTFTGRVDDDELPCIYAGADVFVYPSLMEGFGLPLLEAMANGIPVVCSCAGPLREVAGEAAVFFDPTDVQDMARAIREILGDIALRERLVASGLKRVQQFSFCRAAKETLSLYREVMHGNGDSTVGI
jgi:glycosyltransferase involved in cell wall biosynthesis